MNHWAKYASELRFFLVLSLGVVASFCLSRYIPDDHFDRVVSPVLVAVSSSLSLFGAWMMFRRSGGLRVRRMWGWTLLLWGLADGAYLLLWLTSIAPAMNMAAYRLTTLELLLGNLLGWTLLLYPTEALRPGWMTPRRALIQILPMLVLALLDYFVPANLQPLVILYPLVLIGLLLTHVKKYHLWCEENYSSLEDIEVEWIVRYLAMLVLVGLVYFYMCIAHGHARGFTQLWLTIFMFAYSTEQILFRRDPWTMLHPRADKNNRHRVEAPSHPEHDAAHYRRVLEEWMEREKPHLNPDFKLLDLQAVLPMNRTYLSHFIHTEYGNTFYQFVNHHRIREAKRLKTEHPEIRMADLSARCGFSSPSVFSRTFTAVTGLPPHKWTREADPQN